MIPNPALPARRYATVAGTMLLLLVMAAITWYSNTTSGAALDAIVERNVKPLLALQVIERQVKEVRFRVAAVILDQLPAVGSRQHLAAARAAIPAAWDEYRKATATAEIAADEQEAIARLQRGFGELTHIFDKLDRTYAADDGTRELAAVLEDEWPAVTAGVIKPMDRLIAIRERNMTAAYAASQALGTRLNIAAIAMSLLLGLLALHVLKEPEVLRREVARRTHDLRAANAKLEAEIAERLQAEQALRDSEGRLEKRVAERTADLTSANDALKRVNRELEDTHSQLLHAEKMASVGQLAAGVAHEINNPIGFVNSNLGSLQHYVDRLLNLIDALCN
jgi:C4-dicarboxylate-specific signal transduction histidine kinase